MVAAAIPELVEPLQGYLQMAEPHLDVLLSSVLADAVRGARQPTVAVPPPSSMDARSRLTLA